LSGGGVLTHGKRVSEADHSRADAVFENVLWLHSPTIGGGTLKTRQSSSTLKRRLSSSSASSGLTPIFSYVMPSSRMATLRAQNGPD
jgi:hypothetical protein